MISIFQHVTLVSLEVISIFRVEKTEAVNGCDCWGRPEYDDVYEDDTFDLNKGLNLAKKRLIVKYLDKQVKLIAKAM